MTQLITCFSRDKQADDKPRYVQDSIRLHAQQVGLFDEETGIKNCLFQRSRVFCIFLAWHDCIMLALCLQSHALLEHGSPFLFDICNLFIEANVSVVENCRKSTFSILVCCFRCWTWCWSRRQVAFMSVVTPPAWPKTFIKRLSSFFNNIKVSFKLHVHVHTCMHLINMRRSHCERTHILTLQLNYCKRTKVANCERLKIEINLHFMLFQVLQ